MILNEILMESVSTFWGLRLFLVAVIVFCSWGITYKNKDNNYFWYYAIPIIVFYTLIQGLRFNRGVDYPQYAEELQYDIYSSLHITREFLYDLFVMAFRNFKIPYYFGFMVYSGLLIWGVMLVVKKFYRYAFWIVPIFYFLTLDASENFIRQYIAIAFVFFAYYYYMDNNKKMMYIMLLVIPFIHLSGLFVVGVFLICTNIDFTKYIRTPIPLLGFFLVLTVVWDITNLDGFSDILQSTDTFESTNFEGYVDNSDKWFTEEGDLDKAKGVEESAARKLTEFLCNCAIIWFGFAVTKEDRRFNFAYYGSYVAIIIGVIGGSIELIGRMAWWLLPLEPFVIGGMFKPAKKYSITEYALMGLFILTYYVKFFMQVGKPGLFGSAFVWDIVS